MTWYNPALCLAAPSELIPHPERNCYDPAQWWRMGTGEDARDWYDHPSGLRALACPFPDFERGTIFEIAGTRWGLGDGRWICLDAGGDIFVQADGVIRLDLLSKNPIWRETVGVLIISPFSRVGLIH